MKYREISGFHCSVYTVFAFLDQGSSNLSPLKMGPTGSPETSAYNHQHTLRNNPNKRRPLPNHLLQLSGFGVDHCINEESTNTVKQKQFPYFWYPHHIP
jgi:hypothetical protein